MIGNILGIIEHPWFLQKENKHTWLAFGISLFGILSINVYIDFSFQCLWNNPYTSSQFYVLTTFSSCCLYVHGWRVICWNMSNLPVTITQRKWLSFLGQPAFANSSSTWEPPSYAGWVLTSLILCRQSQLLWEMLFPNSLSLTSGSYRLSVPSSMFPEPCSGGPVIQMSCLVFNIP